MNKIQLNSRTSSLPVSTVLLICLFSPFLFLIIGLFQSGSKAQNKLKSVPKYVGGQTCAKCHQEQYDAWSDSHHAWAWRRPTSDNVLGNFNNATFEHDGFNYRFVTEGEDYFVFADNASGQNTRYKIHSVVGVAPLQQYLIETEKGRLQALDVSWDTLQKRWYHLYPGIDTSAGKGLHWSGPYKNWNARCAECHATGFKKNYTPRKRSYSSTQVEIGVGCEACHGPGEAHEAWANPNLAYNADDWRGVSPTGLTMDFKRGAEATIEQCATCHARREPYLDGNPLPGTPFHDTYNLSTLRPGNYHADGQILEEVYVYGSFLQSKMYKNGVSCTDCHTAHTAKLRADGNAVCTQCHSPAGNTKFPSLRKAKYDNPAHHFHQPGSDSAQCKSCHMIERDYMGIDGRRDHSFRVPRPDLSVTLGTPNACSDCHEDKSASWAAETVAKWYPGGRHTTQHFAQVLKPARLNPAQQTRNLIDIAINRDSPGIVRASAIELLAQVNNPKIADQTASLLSDPNPLVRSATIRLQRSTADSVIVQRLLPLLEDPSRSVRMAAAKEFLNIQALRLPENHVGNLQKARAEWQKTLTAKADFPEVHVIIAGIGLATRRFDAALSAFQQVVLMDPQHVDAWTMMVRIHAAMGRRQAALATLDRAMAANPRDVSLPLLREELRK